MPEIVAKYVQTMDYRKCQELQRSLLETFRADFKKYAKKYQIKYLRQLFDTLPLQAGRKFKYSNVSQNVKSRDLAQALDLLEMAGLVYKVCHSDSNGIPLGAEKNEAKFKVLFFDMGLAQQLLGLNLSHLFLNPDITGVNQGAMAELFVGLELMVYQDPLCQPQLYYWHREARSSNAEVDYVISIAGKVFPVEVKSSSEGRMLSMKRFLEAKKTEIGVRISKYNYSEYQSIRTIPFYGIEGFCKPGGSIG